MGPCFRLLISSEPCANQSTGILATGNHGAIGSGANFGIASLVLHGLVICKQVHYGVDHRLRLI